MDWDCAHKAPLTRASRRGLGVSEWIHLTRGDYFVLWVGCKHHLVGPLQVSFRWQEGCFFVENSGEPRGLKLLFRRINSEDVTRWPHSEASVACISRVVTCCSDVTLSRFYWCVFSTCPACFNRRREARSGVPSIWGPRQYVQCHFKTSVIF